MGERSESHECGERGWILLSEAKIQRPWRNALRCPYPGLRGEAEFIGVAASQKVLTSTDFGFVNLLIR